MKRWLVEIASPCTLLVALTPRVCGAVPPVVAQSTEPPETRTPPSQVASRWYGWQTFAADGVAGALFLGAVADDYSTTLFGFSGLTFALGGPTFHAAHGRWGVAVGSLGLRILGPFVGAIIGAQADVRSYDDAAGADEPEGKWGAAGAGIGGLVVSAIDGALIAYDTPVSNSVPPRNELLRAAPLPELRVLRHGFALGYSGQF